MIPFSLALPLVDPGFGETQLSEVQSVLSAHAQVHGGQTGRFNSQGSQKLVNSFSGSLICEADFLLF